jgi:8-oxo-dGDP phosphatase
VSDEAAGSWWETVRSETVHEGVLSDIRIDTVRTPDGDEVEREVVVHPDAVALVPLMDDGTVLLLRQYRQPFRAYQLEIPAGKLDAEHEPPEETARRELREEVGVDASELVHLTTFENSSGWTDEVTHVYLATGLHERAADDSFTPEHEEADLEVVRIAFRDAVEAVRAGEITDAKTIVGLLLAEGR